MKARWDELVHNHRAKKVPAKVVGRLSTKQTTFMEWHSSGLTNRAFHLKHFRKGRNLWTAFQRKSHLMPRLHLQVLQCRIFHNKFTPLHSFLLIVSKNIIFLESLGLCLWMLFWNNPKKIGLTPSNTIWFLVANQYHCLKQNLLKRRLLFMLNYFHRRSRSVEGGSLRAASHPPSQPPPQPPVPTANVSASVPTASAPQIGWAELPPAPLKEQSTPVPTSPPLSSLPPSPDRERPTPVPAPR